MLARTRGSWLALAILPCSTLALWLGAGDGRGPLHSRALPAAPEREPVEVRGRRVGAPENTDELAVGPRRTASETRSRCEPRPAEPGTKEVLAALCGRITRERCGLHARVRFELGADQGLTLDTAGDGSFACRSLRPGFQRVTVTV